MERIFVIWARLVIAVQGVRLQMLTEAGGKGQQAELDGRLSGAKSNPMQVLVPLSVAFHLSPSHAFTSGRGVSGAVGPRSSFNRTLASPSGSSHVTPDGLHVVSRDVAPRRNGWENDDQHWQHWAKLGLVSGLHAEAYDADWFRDAELTSRRRGMVTRRRLVWGRSWDWRLASRRAVLAYAAAALGAGATGSTAPASFGAATTIGSGALSPPFVYAGQSTGSQQEVLKIAKQDLTPFQQAHWLRVGTEIPSSGKATNGYSHDNIVNGT